MDLQGAVAVVTGGAHRLGQAITLTLARAGCHLVVNYRESAAAAHTTVASAQEFGIRAIAIAADVGRADEVDRLLAATLAEFRRVDVLVANAGAFRRTPVATMSATDWDDMIAGNLRTAFLCAHAFGLQMRAHGGGAIVTLADVAGVRPWADYLPYSVAKAGVIALTQGLARALAPEVRVNAVAPGPVLFPENFDPALAEREVSRTLLKRAGHPQNVADAVLELVRNDYITGVVLPVDGGRLLS